MSRRITIVGGGLSGLVLAIGLRQHNVPVSILESGQYPRHRVCGEFVCGQGKKVLARMGLMQGLSILGFRDARHVSIFAGGRKIAAMDLAETAICVSRFVLDEWLAAVFVGLGGNLQTGIRWNGDYCEGMVRATGRRNAATEANRNRAFGLKIHALGVEPFSDLEMHFTPTGYVGICRLPGGLVNICGLFGCDRKVARKTSDWRQWLEVPAGSLLERRLSRAEFLPESRSAIAGLSLQPDKPVGRMECCVGDAISMIAPLTGNGMSMALESAEMAVEPLTAYSQGRRSWENARKEIARQCESRFKKRLRWSAILQIALFKPGLRNLLFFLVGNSSLIRQAVFKRTR